MIIKALKTLTWGTLAFAVISAVLLAAAGGGSLRIDTGSGAALGARPGSDLRTDRATEAQRAGRVAPGNGSAGPSRDPAAH